MKQQIRLSDHFTYRKLLQFVFPVHCHDDLYVDLRRGGRAVRPNFAGKTAFAAINLVMPFIMVLGGIGFMIGTGGTALVSKRSARAGREEANRYFFHDDPLYGAARRAALGDRRGVHAAGRAVSRRNAGGCWRTACAMAASSMRSQPRSCCRTCSQSFLIAAEKPKLGLAATVAAGVTNMALDALFVAGFRWGIAGAAVATGLSQCVGGLFPLVYFLRPNSSRLRLVRTRLELRPLLNACGNGSSELMSNISSSIVSMLYNFQLLKYIGEDGVSAYGVLMYVQFIFIAIDIGYSIGCAPVVGFHYGAQNHAELKKYAQKEAFC